MANIDAPNGLEAVRSYIGGEVQTRQYYIASGLAENIGLNAPVKSTGTNKRIQLATPGDTVQGVFAGVNWTDVNGTPRFSKSWSSGTVTLNSADAQALVYDDPGILYAVQASGAFSEADIGLNADLTAGTANSIGMSTAEVDSGTYTTVTAQVRIVDYLRDGQNEATTNAKLLVLLNEQVFHAPTVGV